MWIILIAFINAGNVSIIYYGVPLYNGSKNFSNVDKYLTLSLASFNLSVSKRSNLLYSIINLLIFSSPLLVDLSCYLFLYNVDLT